MSLFKAKDKVMHFREGLSFIEKETSFNGCNYFVVKLMREGGESIFVPIDKAEAVIRHLTPMSEIDELISYMRSVEPEYVTNTKQRRDNFKRKLTSGDIHDLAYLTRQLYFFQNPDLLEVPVKFGPADVEMLKFANRTLYDELSLTLKKDRNDVEDIVIKMIKNA